MKPAASLTPPVRNRARTPPSRSANDSTTDSRVLGVDHRRADIVLEHRRRQPKGLASTQ
jgi:hypothetical protein